MNAEFTAPYDPTTDTQYNRPYIDIDEWRARQGVRCRYVHGGFRGTDARFSFFFPEPEHYEGRFFHFVAPMQNHEDASDSLTGLKDRITFALTHGAYFVETNMGFTTPFASFPDPTMMYRESACAAEYSRTVAADMYGPHRPYGYVYGGSGGGYKSIACVQNTATWDGSVPYIIGTPTSIPNTQTIRSHGKRVLRHCFGSINDALEPGGSGDPFAGLTDEETAFLHEVTDFGFPLRTWALNNLLDDGSLPVVRPLVDSDDDTYFDDFWTKPGYLGYDPNGSAARDRIRFETKVVRVHVPGRVGDDIDTHATGANSSFERMNGVNGMGGRPWIELESLPEGDPYVYFATLKVTSGASAGFEVPLESRAGNVVTLAPGFGIQDMAERLSAIKPGDTVFIDNSDYIAIQTYHRHQVPRPGEDAPKQWDIYRDEHGEPIYPRRAKNYGPGFALSGCGSLQNGKFNGKMIVCLSQMDESAFPAQADWYVNKVREWAGDDFDDRFRVYVTDHAIHDDGEEVLDDTHLVSYLGTLYQSLLDLAAWVERGVEPNPSTRYVIDGGQMLTPNDPDERKGLQPMVTLLADGLEAVHVRIGEPVHLVAEARVPNGTGRVVTVEWNFGEGEGYGTRSTFDGTGDDGERGVSEIDHIYSRPGTYFPVVRVAANRYGDPDDRFGQILNLCRARVIVDA